VCPIANSGILPLQIPIAAFLVRDCINKSAQECGEMGNCCLLPFRFGAINWLTHPSNGVDVITLDHLFEGRRIERLESDDCGLHD
jgi:hypothetical protein